MSPDEKLTDEEKAKLQESLGDASLDDVEMQGMAQGLDDSEPVMMPVDSSDDLLSAAAVEVQFGRRLIYRLHHREIAVRGALVGPSARGRYPAFRLGYSVAERQDIDPAGMVFILGLAVQAVDFHEHIDGEHAAAPR